jgi:hypothetical protein
MYFGQVAPEVNMKKTAIGQGDYSGSIVLCFAD